MGEMIALQSLRTVKKFDMKVADKLYIGLIKDLHHMGEIDYTVSDGYDVAQTAICFPMRGHSIRGLRRRLAEKWWKEMATDILSRDVFWLEQPTRR